MQQGPAGAGVHPEVVAWDVRVTWTDQASCYFTGVSRFISLQGSLSTKNKGEWEGVSTWMETQEGEDDQEGRTHSVL